MQLGAPRCGAPRHLHTDVLVLENGFALHGFVRTEFHIYSRAPQGGNREAKLRRAPREASNCFRQLLRRVLMDGVPGRTQEDHAKFALHLRNEERRVEAVSVREHKHAWDTAS